MLSTNLLPPEQKNKIRLEEARRAVILFAAALSGIFLLGSPLLTPIYLGAAFQIREAKRMRTLEEEAAEKLNLNKNTVLVLKTERAIKNVRESLDAPPRAGALADVFLQEEPGILITGFTAKYSGEVTLAGQARTRRALLDFEKRLRESGRFQEFSFPLSNLTRETDINFSMRGVLTSRYRF